MSQLKLNLSPVRIPREAQLSTVSEISLEESVNPTISELNESVLPLSETQVLLSDEEGKYTVMNICLINLQTDGIINQKNLKNEVIEENEGDLLQASEIDKTLTFGSFDNVIPFVMSVPPRPEAIKLANLLNSQKISAYTEYFLLECAEKYTNSYHVKSNVVLGR
ncbi:unnamed protein product [Schistosoma margrebowiei]|uniref:Uncharacterized protein n=1 Tax=Schistosoma margrebowiei TaxID=48269 RepID=A0A183MBB3_9TREM|nr:unnamed protein product [Schistosoma margrebowiei]